MEIAALLVIAFIIILIGSSLQIKITQGGESMSYIPMEDKNKEKFSFQDFFIMSVLTKEQIEKIEALTREKDFYSANFDDKTGEVSTSSWDDYDTMLFFFRKLGLIVPDIEEDIIVENDTTDEYWIVHLKGKEVEEIFGYVFWDRPTYRAKIENVLRARIAVKDDTIFADITDQIVRAIKGEFDNIEETVSTTEETSEEEKKPEEEVKPEK